MGDRLVVRDSVSKFADQQNLELVNRYRNFEEKKFTDVNNYTIFANWVESSAGSYKFIKLITNAFKWTVLIGQRLKFDFNSIQKFINVNKQLGFVSKALILTKVPATYENFRNSIKSYNKQTKQLAIRQRDKLIKTVVETISDTGFLLQFGEILGVITLGSFKPLVSFSSSLFLSIFHMVSIKFAAEDLSVHKKLQRIAQNTDSERFKIITSECKNLELLKLVKSVTALALSFFTIAEMLSIIALSQVAMLTLSTTSIVLAMWVYFYQESMTYPKNHD